MINSSLDNTPDSQALLNQIVIEYLHEQKRKRRWRWLSRMLIIVVIIVCLVKFSDLFTEKNVMSKPHAGLIELNGAIFDSMGADADNFAKSLDSAYKSKDLKALVIKINSPGGSPVQADYMYNALQHYRKIYPAVKIYAVCVDVCASAAYYVAAAADSIYASESSIVGSIGVVYNGFGFVDALAKLGITRRLQTAGVNKGFLDPFSPESPGQQQLLQGMLDDVHQQFIDKVKAGRGDRLKINDQTFSGLFWTGKQAKEQGLIDGFGSSGQVVRDVLQLQHVVNYTFKPGVLERVSKNIGTAAANQLPTALGLQSGMQE